MEIAVEYIEWLASERRRINSVPLEDITFYRNGMKLNITRKAIEDFVFTGLLNTDFVSTGALDEGICKKITTPKMMRNKK
jgi:hypothetical protein